MTVSPLNPLEGTAFAQKGGDHRIYDGTFDKKYWKDKECYKCHKKGHPSNHCPDNKKDSKKKDTKNKDNDDKTVSSKSSKASKANSINKAQKQLK